MVKHVIVYGVSLSVRAPGNYLDDDPAEQNNLFDKHPAIVKRLTALLERYKKQGRSTPID